MRFAVISDIHGNLAALEAVLADIAQRQVDFTVNLGDLVSGPLLPRETADRLRPLNMLTIQGNHERQLFTHRIDKMSPSDQFAATRLTPDQRQWLATFPATATLPGGVLLCHGTPDSDLDYLLETIDETGCRQATREEIEARLTNCPASLILCGHTHLPRSIHLADGRIVLNPGSVGLQAYKAEWPHPHVIEAGSPHARYAVVEARGNTWSIHQLSVEYDWESAAQLAEANGRDDWAIALRSGAISHNER